MRAEIPIFRQIKFDVMLSAREQMVFWAAVELLDLVEERHMTLTALEHALLRLQRESNGPKVGPISRSTISGALTSLEVAGYLCRDVADDGRSLFRVPLSRRPMQSEPAPESFESKGKAKTRAAGVVSEAFG